MQIEEYEVYLRRNLTFTEKTILSYVAVQRYKHERGPKLIEFIVIRKII